MLLIGGGVEQKYPNANALLSLAPQITAARGYGAFLSHVCKLEGPSMVDS
jgi:hypothetical protein